MGLLPRRILQRRGINMKIRSLSIKLSEDEEDFGLSEEDLSPI